MYGNLAEETVCDMLSTLTLHRPFPNAFYGEAHKSLQLKFDSHVEEKVSFWKSAHTRMCVRIEDEIRLKPKSKIVNDMLTALVESVSSLKFSKAEFYEYAVGIMEWVLDEWRGGRAALLDAIQWTIKRLDREQVTEM